MSERWRGPAALLAVPLLAGSYLALAPLLPQVLDADLRVITGGGVGLLAVGACALAPVAARREPVTLVLLVAGGALVAGALEAGGAGVAADPFRALASGALGCALARVLDDRRSLVWIPLLVATLDAASVAGGPASDLVSHHRLATSLLSYELPYWGGVPAAAALGTGDTVLLAMFATWAWERGLRARLTVACLLLALEGALGLGLATRGAVPVLPLLAAALLVPNLDRLTEAVRGDGSQSQRAGRGGPAAPTRR